MATYRSKANDKKPEDGQVAPSDADAKAAPEKTAGLGTGFNWGLWVPIIFGALQVIGLVVIAFLQSIPQPQKCPACKSCTAAKSGLLYSAVDTEDSGCIDVSSGHQQLIMKGGFLSGTQYICLEEDVEQVPLKTVTDADPRCTLAGSEFEDACQKRSGTDVFLWEGRMYCTNRHLTAKDTCYQVIHSVQCK